MTGSIGPRTGVVALVLGLAMMSGAAALAEGPRCAMTAEQVFETSGSSVVEVFSLAIDQFRVMGRILPSMGTGFFLPDGHVVTNYHVVADSGSVVVYDDRGAWDAVVVGTDPLLDIAVLRPVLFMFVENPGLEFSPPGSLKVGQAVFPVGYPRGMGKTITQGIVTGTSRVVANTTSSWLSPFIQTDAAINPGNSGGPLLDDCGRVLGMVSKGGRPEMVENIAFAIPTEVLRPIVEELIGKGHVARAWHGLYGQMVTPPILSIMGVPFEEWEDATGFLVETVEPGSAGETAGLRGGNWPIVWGGTEFLIGGDIITEVNGQRITDRKMAMDIVRVLKVGQSVTLKYLRDGERHETTVTLPERPLLEADLQQYRGANYAP